MSMQIHHTTSYFYSEPVSFGTHRLMLRPIENHDLRIVESSLVIRPEPRVRWLCDVFGNTVTLADFSEPSCHLVIESRVLVEIRTGNPFEFLLAPHALRYPFQYDIEEQPDLAPFLGMAHPEDGCALRSWVQPFLDLGGGAQTIDFLLAINRSIPRFFSYERREEFGVQPPSQTLHLRRGSCRDFAWLFVETARCCGFAARFVSGYLKNTSEADPDQKACGATHAWAQVYLPGAGWRDFDPTCGMMGGSNHVRTAVGRIPSQAVPVSGSFTGLASAFNRMEVSVSVFDAEHIKIS